MFIINGLGRDINSEPVVDGGLARVDAILRFVCENCNVTRYVILKSGSIICFLQFLYYLFILPKNDTLFFMYPLVGFDIYSTSSLGRLRSKFFLRILYFPIFIKFSKKT